MWTIIIIIIIIININEAKVSVLVYVSLRSTSKLAESSRIWLEPYNEATIPHKSEFWNHKIHLFFQRHKVIVFKKIKL